MVLYHTITNKNEKFQDKQGGTIEFSKLNIIYFVSVITYLA